jgi:large subunit ribosomal protein L23
MTKIHTPGTDHSLSLDAILKRPRITEKSVRGMNGGSYCFEIDARANKYHVAAAIKHVYKLTPLKVAIVRIPAREVKNRRTGKLGMTAALKKAYVYLKKGDTIAVM